MKKDHKYLILTQYLSKASYNLSYRIQTATQSIEFSLNNIALLNKQLQQQITNKS